MNTHPSPLWAAGLASILAASCASPAQTVTGATLPSWTPITREQPGQSHPTAAMGPANSLPAGHSIEKDDTHSFLPEGYPEPFSADLTGFWFADWPHSHFSRRGTPFVHMFNLEPAFMDRDLFLDYRSARGFGENEKELEVELELALTRRIGLVLEMPYVQLDSEGAPSESGAGDFAIAPRLLLVDSEAFLLSANLEVAVPTGNERKGLGRGELALTPSLSAWFDLGHWVQANVQAGTENGLETGDTELFYNGALSYSFMTPAFFGDAWHEHEHSYMHFPAGLASTILELTGRTALNGLNDGRDTAELLFGLSYNVNGNFGIRAGYQIPMGSDKDIDRAFLLGLIRHF